MRRAAYRITSNFEHNVVKTAYNASIREIERLVRVMARAEGTTYELTASSGIKHGFDFVQGMRAWTSKTGKVAVFNIAKEA